MNKGYRFDQSEDIDKELAQFGYQTKRELIVGDFIMRHNRGKVKSFICCELARDFDMSYSEISDIVHDGLEIPYYFEKLTRPSNFSTISHYQRKALIIDYPHYCEYCGATDNLTFDHIVPRSNGGHRWYNMAVACKTCNSSKRNKSLLSWLAEQ